MIYKIGEDSVEFYDDGAAPNPFKRVLDRDDVTSNGEPYPYLKPHQPRPRSSLIGFIKKEVVDEKN